MSTSTRNAPAVSLRPGRDEGLLVGIGGLHGHVIRLGPSLLISNDEMEEVTCEPFPCLRRRRDGAMIAGLPLGTWLLMAASTVPAVVLVVAAYLIHRDADLRKPGEDSNG